MKKNAPCFSSFFSISMDILKANGGPSNALDIGVPMLSLPDIQRWALLGYGPSL